MRASVIWNFLVPQNDIEFATFIEASVCRCSRWSETWRKRASRLKERTRWKWWADEDKERGKGGRSDRAIYREWLNRDHDGRWRRDRGWGSWERLFLRSLTACSSVVHRGDAMQSASEVARFLPIIDSPMDFEAILPRWKFYGSSKITIIEAVN